MSARAEATGDGEGGLPAGFDPAEMEPRIFTRWLESGLFHPDPNCDEKSEPAYSIAIPPPNVTGSLHMGHALNGSIQDVLIRHHRMRGQPTKWILGTDHAGIATQAQVEKALAREGLDRQSLGREAFVERVWEWRTHYGGTIVEQLKRLGASCDYDEERFTLDEAYAKAVVRVFVSLYRKGYIYRDRYIVNWDPGTRSAISDLEVEEREQTDTLYSIRYDLEGGGALTIATVRPETMLADTAVAVNPEDDRHRDLVGRTAILPLVGRRLPVIADEYVKADFGTGQLKVTPGHDPNDFEIGRRHGLEEISVIGVDGRMSPEAGPEFAGLTVAEAREAVVAALEREGRIVAREPYVHNVPCSHRSGERIEPLISLQWFMRMDELAEPAIEAVRSGSVRIIPESSRKVYLAWMARIRPWCISRQLWWGHQLPVWYCDSCESVHVEATPPERCPGCGGELRRDEDVLDTWFSSALWPFATLGWPESTPELERFYPTDVLSTARDILFLWVARMIMMGIELTGEVPFSDVYVHSVIQAPDGRRMSKSLGTGIDPIEEIDRHGADAVRFGLLAMSSIQDVRYSPEKIKQGQALAVKLFNAVRFAVLRISALPGIELSQIGGGPSPRTVEDRWILSRLQRVKEEAVGRIEAYDFSHLALGLYDFVYGELCDWYIELVKHRLTAGEDAQALAGTLAHVMRETLAIAHPVVPFVTEELWPHLGGLGLLAGAPWPAVDAALIDPQAEREVAGAIEAIKAVRGWRDTVGVKAGSRVRARLAAEGYESTVGAIERLGRLELAGGDGESAGRDGVSAGRDGVSAGRDGVSAGRDGVSAGEDGERAGNNRGPEEPLFTVPIPGGAVEVLSAEGLDVEAIERRRAAERGRLLEEIARAEGKLANSRFLERAPSEVIEREREKLGRLREEVEAL